LTSRTAHLLVIRPTNAIRRVSLLLQLDLLLEKLGYLRIFHQFFQLFYRYIILINFLFLLHFLLVFMAVAIAMVIWILLLFVFGNQV
jgi:hypothetical protein